VDDLLLMQRINGPFPYEHNASPTECGAGINGAIK
jgi:hypothetical protein